MSDHDLADECASEPQLLARLLGGVRPSATLVAACEQFLERRGGLSRLGRMSVRELRRACAAVEGWPASAGQRLCCALAVGRRASRRCLPRERPVHRAADLEPYLRERLEWRLKEVFLVVLLDAKNRPIRAERVSEGCLTWSIVHPREVFAPAVRDGASAIVVAHNHPSGDPTPSQQDRDVTARLAQVGDLLGIPLLDHLVVGFDRCVSLRAAGPLNGGSAVAWRTT